MAVAVHAGKASFIPRRTWNSAKLTRGFFSDVQNREISINVAGVNFSLHKRPLISRSERIRKLVGEVRESDCSIKFAEFPGGTDAFELAAKFCYGINFEITTSNVAYLLCAANYLEMTGEGNLSSRSEAFLNEIVLQSLEKSAEVLHACESILPLAEDAKIVSRCIDAVASEACKEQMASSNQGTKAIVEWWAEDLSALRIDLYQRTLAAMKSVGLRNESIAGSIMHYAQRSLKALNKKQEQLISSGGSSCTRSNVNKLLESEQLMVVETLVSLLPAEKNNVPTSFLLGLLRTAIILDTAVACRLDLEWRIGLQLEEATLGDLLSISTARGALFAVDVVQRVLVIFLQQEENKEQSRSSPMGLSSGFPTRDIVKVAKLIDMYLAEIAAVANIKLSKFTSLAKQLPSNARVLHDRLYRAVDIFLKAHPTLSVLEQKKICKVLDCQKLSQDACIHAAQNDRLPEQFVVQVLYFQKVRMNARAQSNRARSTSGAMMNRMDNDIATLQHKNRGLKLQVGLRLDQQLEKEKEMEKPGSTRKFFSWVSRKFNLLDSKQSGVISCCCQLPEMA